MDISKKIEEIRRKPEHERLRYVWGMVAVSMIFIIIIWIVSLKDNLSNNYAPMSENAPIDTQENIQN
ncbi:MAG: hypothetical protein PHH24_03460 [Candidatus Moranbacteria bacterium]|jgi:hypothetical protein|nr:hypothetical protein [Candidatus Moranbacteria bacterium]MDD5652097.1 hypothetical protein [Candidatus Moranbacteria bacterium]MDX9855575.1 hypothetical protein [Candidatus Moranbacteria bacterium]